jgi:predicted ATPase
MPQIIRALARKAELDNTDEAVWFEFEQQGLVTDDKWALAFKPLSDPELHRLWGNLTGSSGGSRDGHWIPGVIEKLTPTWRSVAVAMIPAIRSVGGKGSKPDGFGGQGLIEKLARLQNPDVHQQSEKRKFARVNNFLQSVTDNRTATLEIPFERDTILVHMNGRTLPLESLGTGIHEVIILAAASTILEETVVCMEEPEIHLNPILQRKLVRYLSDETSNQYFITTHSAALMDTPEAETYHIQLRENQSTVTRVTSDKQRSVVCEDLGYHPSDLLQSNCVIWVEGPSDRTYLAHWISKYAPELVEGIHFTIMFYGGRLASHLSGNDLDGAVEGFISLRRLNRRAVILMDSDRSSKDRPINATKTRLIKEFDEGPGHAWVTDGREIENYIPTDQITAALTAVVSTATATSKFRRYDKMLSIRTAGGKLDQAPKVEIAKHIVVNCDFDDSRLDLKQQLEKLVGFIRESNPTNERVTA